MSVSHYTDTKLIGSVRDLTKFRFCFQIQTAVNGGTTFDVHSSGSSDHLLQKQRRKADHTTRSNICISCFHIREGRQMVETDIQAM